VLNPEQWKIHASKLDLDLNDTNAHRSEVFEKLVCERTALQLSEFPGYAVIRHATCVLEPWTIENELITPTLKLKRNRIMERYAADIEKMYEGHS
jgi:long-chain acyl-CoA synthetase